MYMKAHFSLGDKRINHSLDQRSVSVNLFKKVQLHENQLQIMVDDVDQNKMENSKKNNKTVVRESANAARRFPVISPINRKATKSSGPAP